MKKALKIIGWIVLSIVVLSSVLFVALIIRISMNSEDERLRDDSHLIPKVLSLSILDEENGWIELEKAKESIYYPEEKKKEINEMLLENNWNENLAQEIIEKNRETYKYIDAALGKKYFLNPGMEGVEEKDYTSDLILESGSFIRDLNKVYLVSVKNDLLKNNFNKGIKKLLNNIELGNKLKNNLEVQSLVEYLIGLGISNNNYSFLERLLSEINISKNNAIVLQESLEASKENEEGIANAFKFEYLIIKNELDSIDKEAELEGISLSTDNPFYFKINKTKNMFMDKSERDIENSYRSCDNLIPYNIKQNYKGINKLKVFFSENAIGKTLMDIVTVSLDSVQIKRCEDDFRISALQVQLASNAYKKDKEIYPKTMEELKNSGYLVAEVSENIHGWDVDYDKNTGKLIFPEDIK